MLQLNYKKNHNGEGGKQSKIIILIIAKKIRTTKAVKVIKMPKIVKIVKIFQIVKKQENILVNIQNMVTQLKNMDVFTVQNYLYFVVMKVKDIHYLIIFIKYHLLLL